jgi:hypothetical protein
MSDIQETANNYSFLPKAITNFFTSNKKNENNNTAPIVPISMVGGRKRNISRKMNRKRKAVRKQSRKNQRK